MTLFDGKRLTSNTVGLDIDGLRRGFYSDKYFENVIGVLQTAQAENYHFGGHHARALPVDVSQVRIGDMKVEAQIFTRRHERALIAGIDIVLLMLRHACGYQQGDTFVETWHDIEVEALHDGVMIPYDGHPEHVLPVLKIRGRYQDFALLETPLLGLLTRASRIATNVYDVLEVSNGKPVLFFPARFDLASVQSVDGYAYWLAVQRYNHDTGKQTRASVSTDAQASWWGGVGGGTVPHALIATFLGDTAEAMVSFARYLPLEVPRIALVDFDNDTVGTSLAVLSAYWMEYRAALEANDAVEQRRWRLDGVRLDTSANVRDRALDESDPTGINPKLVRLVRAALDSAWEGWHVPAHLEDAARIFCKNVKIVVTGGFNRERIAQYERDQVPVDIYGVGSSLLRNDSATNSDFTMDVVRVFVEGAWHEVAKVGRRANHNAALLPVDLSEMA